jgi:hypothetical protein
MCGVARGAGGRMFVWGLTKAGGEVSDRRKDEGRASAVVSERVDNVYGNE